MGLEALAAKWRVDPADAACDDAPVHEPMRQGAKPMQRRAPSADQKRVRREMARGQHLPKTAEYTSADFGQTVKDEYDRLQDQRHPSPAKSWNIADQTDRGDGSGDAGGTPVSQSMSDSSVSSGSGTGGSGAGGGSTASRLTPFSAYHHTAAKVDDPNYEWSTGEHAGYANCESCGGEHPAEYDHQETVWNGVRHQETGKPIFAATCPEDGLTDYWGPDGLHRTAAWVMATRNQIGVANSMGQILLKGGDQIRMPTGQSVTVKNVRRHETSRDHYYVDTDMGTTVVPWSTQFDVVRGGQQEVLPGPGISGGNFGDMPGLSGNVEQQGHHQQQNVSNPTDCPSCKTKGSLVRRGGKFQCNQCGFTQNPQGGGGPGTNFSDATQQYVSKIMDPRSAIARRCAAVLAEPDPNQKESL